MRGPPVVLTNTLGRPVTNVISERGAVPMTVVNTLGEPVTLVNSGGEPVTLFNPNGTLWDYPLSLFSSGAQGAWYDPSDFSTLRQDSTGTTPVTAVEQPVGLMLDRSRGLVLGAELVVNGGFDSATSWTLKTGAAISGGKLNINATGDVFDIAAQLGILTQNRWYRITATCDSLTSGTLFVALGDAGLSTRLEITAPGVYTGIFYHTNPVSDIDVRAYGASGGTGATTAVLDNISVRELPGNHAVQATSASRPVLRATNRLDFDGVDDRIAAAAGGGGTTGMLFVAGINLDAVGAASTIWSDTGTNTGYRVRINASNQVEVSAGNGAAYTTAATSETLASGTNYVIAAWHDGTNLNARLGLSGAIAQAAFATATAGTAAFTLGMDNGATSSFLNGKLYNAVYVRNFAGTLSDVNATASYVSGTMA